MALLNNEQYLFEELNLTNISNEPKDFYNFMLYKHINVFNSKISNGIIIDEKTGGNYQRIIEFGLNRTHVKKSLITIPYNASKRSISYYLKGSLVYKGYDEVNKNNLYISSDNVEN